MGEKLEQLGITTVRDFLYHIPFRYDDFSLVSKIALIQPGETVTIQAQVQTFSAFITKNGKRLQEAKVTDETGKLSVIWFNQPFLRSVILPGSTIRLSGPVSWFNHKLVLNAPQYEIVNDAGVDSLHTGRLVPYPETAGLSSKWMRGRIHFT
jgi:ATP-dependent DNA helicase RecG